MYTVDQMGDRLFVYLAHIVAIIASKLPGLEQEYQHIGIPSANTPKIYKNLRACGRHCVKKCLLETHRNVVYRISQHYKPCKKCTSNVTNAIGKSYNLPLGVDYTKLSGIPKKMYEIGVPLDRSFFGIT
jgi:hypothetical protein